MFGWRARIGYINPGVHIFSQEWDKVLPEGVAWAIVTLGAVDKVGPESFAGIGEKMFAAGKILATREVDIICIGGTPTQLHLGHDNARQLAARIQETTGVTTVLAVDGLVAALKILSAKSIVMATPYTDASNQEHAKFLEEQGIKVLAAKGLGVARSVEIGKQPPYASYRLARQAYREAPEAEAIWIGCPSWPTLANIDILENDTGRPVVTDVTFYVYQTLTTIGVKGPINGYGKLLEML